MERSAERLPAVVAPVSSANLEDKLDKLTLQVKKPADEVTTLKELPERAESRAPGVENGPRTSKPSEVICWQCGEQGHVKRDCPLFSKRQVSGKGLPPAPHVKTKEQPDAVMVGSIETSSATWTCRLVEGRTMDMLLDTGLQ